MRLSSYFESLKRWTGLLFVGLFTSGRTVGLHTSLYATATPIQGISCHGWQAHNAKLTENGTESFILSGLRGLAQMM
ncbi:hypothetical protein [Hymenobacter terrestris]|uniref:Secreted protein n=1 Tax=Hymenobacter terrestris TaxID=2748310 RepID=A0ABX2Q4N0_9BACT|nr:hypothetical protein [Hymenobacter terrestris]NVO85260.1 hypothetical protein [Hymenobacter terrestris]